MSIAGTFRGNTGNRLESHGFYIQESFSLLVHGGSFA
jgi:hypothetical protein